MKTPYEEGSQDRGRQDLRVSQSYLQTNKCCCWCCCCGAYGVCDAIGYHFLKAVSRYVLCLYICWLVLGYTVYCKNNQPLIRWQYLHLVSNKSTICDFTWKSWTSRELKKTGWGLGGAPNPSKHCPQQGKEYFECLRNHRCKTEKIVSVIISGLFVCRSV